MEPVLLTRSEIDDRLWDECIDRSRERVIYGFSWYLDQVCEDWNALIWPSASDFKILMPVPLKKRYFLKVVQQPFFCQYLGLFSSTEITPEQAFAFLSALSSNFPFISSYSFNPKNYAAVISLLSKRKELEYEVHETVWLLLKNNFLEIQKQYSIDKKRNLKRSLGWKWTISKSRDIEPLIELFVSNNTATIEGGVSPKSYMLLKCLFEKLTEKNCAELAYVSKDGVTHAGALFINDGSTTIYLFNSSDEMGRKGNARTFLLNRYFESHSGSDILFDFESPQVMSIASFYKSFGGESAAFIHISKNGLPFPLKQIQYVRKWFFKTRQDLF
ncbi:GNAT family N-acetyltransferase [Dyadobacter psychrotolerans]|uniref:GNAT family N-acetyltransferase n=1 Tax=Dyadobacter psychrotolerans TaxID=2541721 RepID=A0A4R5DIJ4_9BACT|nr:GNAT family N-acetyltransferase [Dyadobacter psychrotolerans]TDE10323.1 GNAT family N-acetyltransferase [Dyadobacter psychrotolerans]